VGQFLVRKKLAPIERRGAKSEIEHRQAIAAAATA
jgi:hypothetical protein